MGGRGGRVFARVARGGKIRLGALAVVSTSAVSFLVRSSSPRPQDIGLSHLLISTHHALQSEAAGAPTPHALPGRGGRAAAKAAAWRPAPIDDVSFRIGSPDIAVPEVVDVGAIPLSRGAQTPPWWLADGDGVEQGA